MKKVIIGFLLYSSSCFCEIDKALSDQASNTQLSEKDQEWLLKVESRMSEDDLLWAKESLKASLKEMAPERKSDNEDKSEATPQKGKCKNCFKGELLIEENPEIQIFMSFSLPDGVWISLSKELEKARGVFVLRGLPNNSFNELAEKILNLKKLGVNAEIQINPLPFEKYEIEEVPVFVIAESKCFDKISGNISLGFAVEQMASFGETEIAKIVQKRLKNE